MVDRLTQKVDRLHEEITMYEAQTLAQEEETRSAQRTLAEAVTEIEVRENGNLRGIISRSMDDSSHTPID